jgi:formate dehydrogenase subunit beta
VSQLEVLQARVREDLPKLDRVIGWGAGFDPLHATPLFIRSDDDVDRLIWSPLCVHNLTTYLTGLPGQTGIIVKGCDNRSIVELLQEKLLDRDRLVIYGLPCRGVVDLAKIMRLVDAGRVASVSFADDRLSIEADGRKHDLALREVLAERCLTCRYPNPVIYDHLIGDPGEPEVETEDPYADLQELEAMPIRARFDYWQAQMERCIRCYACRNACPLCVCRDFCIAETRDPHWLSQETAVSEKWLFQMVHALHLAGRCTECGECERACPMNIPLLAFKRKLNKEIKELFDYEAGGDPDAKPPLYTFQVEEAKINERGW